jgi:hypothetical protein
VRVKRKEFKKKIMGRVDFVIAKDIKVGVKFYTTIKKMSK